MRYQFHLSRLECYLAEIASLLATHRIWGLDCRELELKLMLQKINRYIDIITLIEVCELPVALLDEIYTFIMSLERIDFRSKFCKIC